MTWLICSLQPNSQFILVAGALRMNSMHLIPNRFRNQSSCGTSIGIHSGCLIKIILPIFFCESYVWFITINSAGRKPVPPGKQHRGTELLNALDVAVSVTSWSKNWPHCINIKVMLGTDLFLSLWMVVLTILGDGRFLLNMERLGLCMPWCVKIIYGIMIRNIVKMFCLPSS